MIGWIWVVLETQSSLCDENWVQWNLPRYYVRFLNYFLVKKSLNLGSLQSWWSRRVVIIPHTHTMFVELSYIDSSWIFPSVNSWSRIYPIIIQLSVTPNLPKRYRAQHNAEFTRISVTLPTWRYIADSLPRKKCARSAKRNFHFIQIASYFLDTYSKHRLRT